MQRSTKWQKIIVQRYSSVVVGPTGADRVAFQLLCRAGRASRPIGLLTTSHKRRKERHASACSALKMMLGNNLSFFRLFPTKFYTPQLSLYDIWDVCIHYKPPAWIGACCCWLVSLPTVVSLTTVTSLVVSLSIQNARPSFEREQLCF